MLTVSDAGGERREERPGGAVGVRAGFADARLGEFDVERLGSGEPEDGDEVDGLGARGFLGRQGGAGEHADEEEAEEAHHLASVTDWPSVSVAVPTTSTSSSDLSPSRISRFAPSLKPAFKTRRRALPASCT